MKKLGSFFGAPGQGLSLLLTMLVGVLAPHPHGFSFLIPYLLVVMLFFAYLDLELKPQALQRSVLGHVVKSQR